MAEETADVRKLYRSGRKDIHKLLDTKLSSLAEHRRVTVETERALQSAASAALARALQQDEEYAAESKPLLRALGRTPEKLEKSDARFRGPLGRDAALGLLSGSGIRSLGADPKFPMTMTMAKDTNVQIFSPPYQDSWTSTDGGALDHQQLQAWADKSSGQFGFLYTIGKEGGFVTTGAGVLVLFMRQQPGSPPGMGSTGMAQVRTYTPYDYAWRDRSYIATAHQHAGFGVLVYSVDIGGGPWRTEQDWERWIWSDGTSWYDTHTNPSFSNVDYANALEFGDTAPYFQIEPRRMYAAWVWCFGNGDAHGADLTSASFAQAKIEATAQFIVVGQQ